MTTNTRTTAHTVRLHMIPGPALLAMYNATPGGLNNGKAELLAAINAWNVQAEYEGNEKVRNPMT